MDRNAPIGIFDSGVGGLTNTRSIVDLLPNESVIYIGDTEHSPYGPKPIAQVRQYAQNIADDLVERGCKMIVIACNTAASAFLRDARERYDVPVIGVIAPAVRRAAAVTHNGKVGVIGTVGTVNSGAYQELFDVIPGVDCFAQPCPRFVDFVERGITSGRQILGLAEAYLAPLQEQGVDTLVLGCTHYPLLSGVLQLVMGDRVTLVSSAEETAKDVYRILSDSDMLADRPAGTATLRFESTGDPEIFNHLATRFLGPALAGPNVSIG
ncbi:MAG: glutamate racemase [Corynebacterium sp.]|nr:glutamate racemase [Corynebacterium sp.]